MSRGRDSPAHYPIVFRNGVFDRDLDVRPGLMEALQELLNHLAPFLARLRFNLVILGVKKYAFIDPIFVESILSFQVVVFISCGYVEHV